MRHGLPVAAGLVLALALAGHWDAALRFLFGGALGTVEPVLGREAGLYVFRLPLIDAPIDLVLAMCLGMPALQAALAFALGAFRDWDRLEPGLRRGVVAALGWNLILLAGVFGADHVVERYRLDDPAREV